MDKSPISIEIVRSSIPFYSSMGIESCEMILETLRKHYDNVIISVVNDYEDLVLLISRRPGLVFLGVKYIPSNINGILNDDRIWISGELEKAGIKYTGSGAEAISLDFDKTRAKTVVTAAGLKTSLSFSASINQFTVNDKLPLDYPLFIKPPNMGGGKGVGPDSVVRDFKSFNNKIISINKAFGVDALVEEYLTGKEYSVAILDSLGQADPLVMPIELIAPRNNQGDRILGQIIKADDVEESAAVEEGELRDQICSLALNVFRAIGAEDYGRVDIRLSSSGESNFLEANLIPGLALHSFTSYFMSACEINLKMSYEEIILYITNLGLQKRSGTTIAHDDETTELKPIYAIPAVSLI